MTVQNEKGFTLLEVIMAISILTIGLLAVASMQGAALRGDAFAQSRTEGVTLGQDKLEELLTLPFDGLTSGNYNAGDYNIEWDVAAGTVANTKEITVTVTYRGKQINQLICVRSMLLE